MRHGLQLAGITLLLLAGVNIVWDCLCHYGLWAHMTGKNFHHILEATESVLVQALTAGKCLLLGLCKETVKQSKCITASLQCLWWNGHFTYNFPCQILLIQSNFFPYLKSLSQNHRNFFSNTQLNQTVKLWVVSFQYNWVWSKNAILIEFKL